MNSYFEPSPDGVRVRDFARELPGAISSVGQSYGDLANKTGRVLKNIGRDAALAPIRVGASLAEIPNDLSGKAPFQSFDVPVLGKTSTYARQSVDTAEAGGNTPMAVTAGILGASGNAILDTIGVGKAAQAGVNAASDLFTAPAQKASVISDNLFRDANKDFSDANYVKMYDKYIQAGDLPADAIYKDQATRIMQPEAAQQLISNNSKVLDSTKAGLGDELTKRFAKAADVTPEQIQEASKQILTNATVADFVKNPSAYPLFRGETGQPQVGGTHFATDSTWAQQFAKDGQPLLQGTLPKGAKIKAITGNDIQEAVKKGFTNENQWWNDIFKKGYDAVIGTDAMNGGALDIIVNPKHLPNFSPVAR